ncbi:hypothetical protein TNCV_2865841 [Trichonephila clavipes]|nr:hypothetical protein TNCV_2865841 [Trichonephila clavipes]
MEFCSLSVLILYLSGIKTYAAGVSDIKEYPNNKSIVELSKWTVLEKGRKSKILLSDLLEIDVIQSLTTPK